MSDLTIGTGHVPDVIVLEVVVETVDPDVVVVTGTVVVVARKVVVVARRVVEVARTVVVEARRVVEGAMLAGGILLSVVEEPEMMKYPKGEVDVEVFLNNR
jgi:hypothetical protein